MTTALGQAVGALKHERERQLAQLRQLDQLITASQRLGKLFATTPTKPRSRMSVAARKRIAVAQHKRWAKWRKSR